MGKKNAHFFGSFKFGLFNKDVYPFYFVLQRILPGEEVRDLSSYNQLCIAFHRVSFPGYEIGEQGG